MQNTPLKIAVAGVGTVGRGVLEILQKKSFLKKINLNITAIASRRKIKLNKDVLKNTIIFKDARELLKFDNYDILLEIIGGEEGIAKELVFNALKNRKNVVTANKALMSKYWNELQNLSKKYGSTIKYEAAVAGGIPIIKILDEFLISNSIKRIYGILNGTSNFIITNMQERNESFDNILKKAQDLGYAESNPKLDIDGTDTAQKLSILSSLSFGIDSNIKKIYKDGIQNIDLIDLKYAHSLGFKLKLLGIAEKKNNCLSSFVYPCFVNTNEIISRVDGVFNAVVVESDFCKKNFFLGEGAGAHPTATSIVSDVIDICRSNKNFYTNKEIGIKKITFNKIEERIGSYYLRFTTFDQPGVISGISNEFKKNNISMKSMLQKDPHVSNQKFATIVVTTHNCLEKNMIQALKRIDKLKFIVNKTVYYRIETLNN